MDEQASDLLLKERSAPAYQPKSEPKRYEPKSSVKRRMTISSWRGYHEPRELPEARGIGDIVSQVMQGLQLGERLNTEKVAQVWSRVVGEPYADMTRPVSWKKGVLTIAVNQPTAHYSIRGAKANILKGLGEHLEKDLASKIKDIKFRVGS